MLSTVILRETCMIRRLHNICACQLQTHLLCVAVHCVKWGSFESVFDMALMQGEVSVPIVMNAIIEQVSRTAAGESLLAAAQAADQEAAAAAALSAAFASFDSGMANAAQKAEGKPQGRKIIYEGDSVASAAAGIVTGVSRFTALHCVGLAF